MLACNVELEFIAITCGFCSIRHMLVLCAYYAILVGDIWHFRFKL